MLQKIKNLVKAAAVLIMGITLVLSLGGQEVLAQSKTPKTPKNEKESAQSNKKAVEKPSSNGDKGAAKETASKPSKQKGKSSKKTTENTKPKREMVTINFGARPSGAKAKVIYGRDTLGTTPFALRMPKGSGFRDVRVVAPGYIPLNTRFHTFKDHARVFRLVRKKDAHTLLGFKHKPKTSEADAEGSADGASSADGQPTSKTPKPKAEKPAKKTSPAKK